MVLRRSRLVSRVPEHPGYEDVVGEAHATPVLEAGVRDLSSQPASLQLDHRGQLRHIPDNNKTKQSSKLISFLIKHVLLWSRRRLFLVGPEKRGGSGIRLLDKPRTRQNQCITVSSASLIRAVASDNVSPSCFKG